MATVKVGIVGLPVPDKIQYTRQLVIDMTGNPNFPTPAPDLADVALAATNLETAYNNAQTARQMAKAKTGMQDTASAELDLIVTQLANYVENASGGDADIIKTAGFSVKAPGTPIGQLPAPTGLFALPSEHQGSADLGWDPMRGARSFIIERAADSAEPLAWTQAGVSTRAKATVNTMTPGNKYWFRVSAVGAAGASAWSDPVPLIAP